MSLHPVIEAFIAPFVTPQQPSSVEREFTCNVTGWSYRVLFEPWSPRPYKPEVRGPDWLPEDGFARGGFNRSTAADAWFDLVKIHERNLKKKKLRAAALSSFLQQTNKPLTSPDFSDGGRFTRD